MATPWILPMHLSRLPPGEAPYCRGSLMQGLPTAVRCFQCSTVHGSFQWQQKRKLWCCFFAIQFSGVLLGAVLVLVDIDPGAIHLSSVLLGGFAGAGCDRFRCSCRQWRP